MNPNGKSPYLAEAGHVDVFDIAENKLVKKLPCPALFSPFSKAQRKGGSKHEITERITIHKDHEGHEARAKL